MKVLVCGGRDYKNWHHVYDSLDALRAEHGDFTVIEGGARGVDNLARRWAQREKLPVETFHAQWGVHGTKAGPIRNHQMLHVGKPDLVLAFPGGRGTADMVRQATAAGVDVMDMTERTDL